MPILKVKNELGIWEDIPAIVGKTGATGPQGIPGATVASGVANTPAGNIAATNVQAAINELDTEKAAIAQEAWITPSLQNSWVNYGGTWETCQYFKDNFGIVHIKGMVKSGTVGAAIFTLPVGYRPSAEQLFPSIKDDLFGITSIAADGIVKTRLGSNGFFCLNGITFKVV